MLSSVTGPACADVQYGTSGEDLYRIQIGRDVFAGLVRGYRAVDRSPRWQGLRASRRARDTRATAPTARRSEDARFVQILRPDGTFEDRVDDDPDFLTILNQPFAVRLDAPTLRDLRTLHGSVPFSTTSPLGGEAMLHGFLRPATSGPIGGRPTVAVRFEADGAMSGPLPGSRRRRLVAGHDAHGRNRLLRARRRDAAWRSTSTLTHRRSARDRAGRRSRYRCESSIAASIRATSV